MAIELMTEEMRREAWLAERRKHITSSDIAALMGLPDAYGSPMGVYLEKKNLLERGEAPTYLEAGLRLQPVILDWYSDQRQVAIQHADPYELVVCKEHPVLAASLDARWHEGDLRPVDAKNVRIRRTEEWGATGTDEIPARYVVQLHMQMLCIGVRVAADLATLFAGADPGWFSVAYDPEIGGAVIEAAEAFWAKHVLADIPPPVDASDEWKRFLGSRRQTSKDLVSATPETEATAFKLRSIESQIDELQSARTLYQNQLKLAIGEHAGMLGRFGKINFTQSKDRQSTDWEAILRDLGVPVPADLIVKHTETKPGSRSFRPYWKD